MPELSSILGAYNYWASIALMVLGFHSIMTHSNLIKKMMGLAIFQVSVLLLYISISKTHGAVPILLDNVEHYTNPLPHVLMLTAIVVGVAVMAVGLAIAVRIHEEFGTLNEEKLFKKETPSESER